MRTILVTALLLAAGCIGETPEIGSGTAPDDGNGDQFQEKSFAFNYALAESSGAPGNTFQLAVGNSTSGVRGIFDVPFEPPRLIGFEASSGNYTTQELPGNAEFLTGAILGDWVAAVMRIGYLPYVALYDGDEMSLHSLSRPSDPGTLTMMGSIEAMGDDFIIAYSAVHAVSQYTILAVEPSHDPQIRKVASFESIAHVMDGDIATQGEDLVAAYSDGMGGVIMHRAPLSDVDASEGDIIYAHDAATQVDSQGALQVEVEAHGRDLAVVVTLGYNRGVDQGPLWELHMAESPDWNWAVMDVNAWWGPELTESTDTLHLVTVDQDGGHVYDVGGQNPQLIGSANATLYPFHGSADWFGLLSRSEDEATVRIGPIEWVSAET